MQASLVRLQHESREPSDADEAEQTRIVARKEVLVPGHKQKKVRVHSERNKYLSISPSIYVTLYDISTHLSTYYSINRPYLHVKK